MHLQSYVRHESRAATLAYGGGFWNQLRIHRNLFRTKISLPAFRLNRPLASRRSVTRSGWVVRGPLPMQVRDTEDYFNYFIQPLWGQISLHPLSDEMNCCPAAVYQPVTQRELASHKAGTQSLTHHYTWVNTHTLQ